MKAILCTFLISLFSSYNCVDDGLVRFFKPDYGFLEIDNMYSQSFPDGKCFIHGAIAYKNNESSNARMVNSSDMWLYSTPQFQEIGEVSYLIYKKNRNLNHCVVMLNEGGDYVSISYSTFSFGELSSPLIETVKKHRIMTRDNIYTEAAILSNGVAIAIARKKYIIGISLPNEDLVLGTSYSFLN